jgi:hypothetical protein
VYSGGTSESCPGPLSDPRGDLRLRHPLVNVGPRTHMASLAEGVTCLLDPNDCQRRPRAQGEDG